MSAAILILNMQKYVDQKYLIFCCYLLDLSHMRPPRGTILESSLRQRDLEFAQRDLEFVQRDLEFPQRDLEFRSFFPTGCREDPKACPSGRHRPKMTSKTQSTPNKYVKIVP